MEELIVMHVFMLLVVFQVKHFVSDYLFQNEYMAFGKALDVGWIRPLALHASIHGSVTLIISFAYLVESNYWYYALAIAACLGCMDSLIHFCMDRIKAGKQFLGRYSYRDKEYWVALGGDQMVHHLTHYAIIYFLLMFAGLVG